MISNYLIDNFKMLILEVIGDILCLLNSLFNFG